MNSVQGRFLVFVTTGKLFLQEFRMRKSFFLLLAVIGFFLFVVGFHLFSNGAIAPAVIVFIAGGGIAYWVYWWDLKREKIKGQKQHERITARIAFLTKEPWSNHQVLIINASIGWYPSLIFGVCLFFIFPIILFHQLTNFPEVPWAILVAGASMLCMGVLLLAQSLPLIGKPLAELTAKGIKTPLYGMISWFDIEGIDLHTADARLGRVYTLVLSANQCLKKDHFHWTRRGNFLGFFSPKFPLQEIRVPLPFSRESPEVIMAVARFLWTQARATEFSQDVEKRVEKIQALYKSGDSKAFMDFANEELQKIEQMNL